MSLQKVLFVIVVVAVVAVCLYLKTIESFVFFRTQGNKRGKNVDQIVSWQKQRASEFENKIKT